MRVNSSGGPGSADSVAAASPSADSAFFFFDFASRLAMSMTRCGRVQSSRSDLSPSRSARSSIARMRGPIATRSIGWATRPSSASSERTMSRRCCSSGAKTRRCACSLRPASTPFSTSSFSCAIPASPSAGMRSNGCSSQYIFTRNWSLLSSFVVAHAPLNSFLFCGTMS